MTEPRDLTDLVPAEVRTELAAAVAALELHGPAVTKAPRRLDQATTAAGMLGCLPVTPAPSLAFLPGSMGGVRPTLRPRDSPSAPRAGSQHSMAQVAVPGGGIPWPPGPQRAQLSTRSRGNRAV